MEDKKLKKIGMAAVSASVLTAGTVAIVAAYQAGISFDPSGKDRDIRTNQVVFADDETSNHKEDSEKRESELLQKDQSKDNSSSLRNQADYLFGSEKQLGENAENSAMLNDGTNASAGNQLDNGTQNPGTILDVTGDASNADLIIGGNGSGTGENGTGASDNNGNNGNNGGSGNGDNPGTSTRPADRVQDPDSKKAPVNDNFTNRPYTEGEVESKDNLIVQFIQPTNSGNCLYMGQLIDKTKVYNALDTYVLGFKDSDVIRYNWDEAALDEYVRIDAVSFDGGNTWMNEFPMTIPTDIDEDTMLIKASYRLKKEDEWKEYKDPIIEEEWATYTVKKACLFVLSEPLAEDSEKLDESKVLNCEELKFPETDRVVLFNYVDDILKACGLCDTDDYDNITALHALVPGWKERDEVQPWLYPVMKGRHILEPLDLVPLSIEYQAIMKYYWMTDDFQVDHGASNLYHLQTMTGYEGKQELGKADNAYEMLAVPKYTQSVDIQDDAGLLVDNLFIPDTVLYINESSRGITVNDAFRVDTDNPNYASTKEGVLTNKAGTEYQIIPAKIKELTVENHVAKVNLSGNNQVSLLKLEAESMEQLPELVFDQTDIFGTSLGTKGQNCKVVLKDSLLDTFVQMNINQFVNKNEDTGLSNFSGIASEEEPDIEYKVDVSGQVTGSNGNLRKVIDTGRYSIQLDNTVDNIKGNALAGTFSLNRLQLPTDGDVVKMEKNCFADSNLKTIVCYSQKQYDYIMANLGNSGAPDGVSVEFTNLQTSKEGYVYYEETKGDTTDYILVEVPEDVTAFDGIVTAQDGTVVSITIIDDNAFAACKDLVWVEVPESVYKIGYEAFYGCSSLQGVMIDTTQYIYIGNKAFDNCNKLRFVASNAMTAEMQDGYDPVVSQTYGWTTFTYFYAPTNSTGYGASALSFNEESGVTSYSMVDIGGGCKMLYGMNVQGYPWLGIRSGVNVGAQVILPSSTVELYSYSMADIRSSEGSYQVNWDDLWMLEYFDEGVFYESDLGGDIILTQNTTYLDNYVFGGCSEIKNFEVSGQLTYLGDLVFRECSSLQSVTLGSSAKGVALSNDLFYGCNALRNLILDDYSNEYELSMQGNTPFQFNSAWTQEEEWEILHIEIPYDPENFYIKKWRFYMVGYQDGYTNQGSINQPAYLNMWEGLYWSYLWENGVYPTYEQIDAEVEEQLLVAENGIRKMFGKEAVDEPTNFFPYRKEGNTLTLIGAPSNIEYAFLYGQMMEFPDGWSLDYIASGAFSKSKNLKSLTFVDNLAGVYPNIFDGVESNEIILRFWTESVPDLIVEKEGVPFTFGVDNSRIKLEINSGMGEAFISGWSYPLAGYSGRETMEEAVKAELLATNGVEPTDEELKVEVDKRILPYMNIVRGWLGLAEMDSVDEIGSGTEYISDTDKRIDTQQNEIESIAQGTAINQEKETKEETEE